MRRGWTAAAVVGAWSLSACVGVAPGSVPPPPSQPPESASRGPQAAAVSGTVFAPAGIISTGGGNIISTGGGNYRTLALTEQPLAGAEVYLAEASGQRIAGLPSARTDAQGRYHLPGVPAGFTYVVAVRIRNQQGQEGHLYTLAGIEGTADVNAATTMAALAATEGRTGALGRLDRAAFERVAATIARGLADGDGIDWTDRGAIKRRLERLTETTAELQSELERLKAEVGSFKASLEDLKAQIAAAKRSGPTPTPVPTLAPTARPTDAPDASPTSGPTPTPGPTATPNTEPVGAFSLVSTFVGQETGAELGKPWDLAFDAQGRLWVADAAQHRILRIAGDGTVAVVAGSGSPGTADGMGTSAQFNGPGGLLIAADGTVYVADTGNTRIRTIAPDGTVATLAGSSPGFKNATGAAAQFAQPIGMALGADGNLYVADSKNNAIRKVTPEGVVTNYAGTGGADFKNGTIGSATPPQFNHPQDLAFGPDGNLYVADTWNHAIRQITPEGVVSTFTGSGGYGGYQDGLAADGTIVKFYSPAGLAFGKDGMLYVSDRDNHLIRTVAPDRTASTLAGRYVWDQTPQPGFLDGALGLARFHQPVGLAVDTKGRLYVADSGNQRIRRLE